MIAISEFSPQFAKLIGKRDPVATLATLVLLSYTKLFSTSILLFSFDTIEYPNNTRVNVWFPDGRVQARDAK